MLAVFFIANFWVVGLHQHITRNLHLCTHITSVVCVCLFPLCVLAYFATQSAQHALSQWLYMSNLLWHWLVCGFRPTLLTKDVWNLKLWAPKNAQVQFHTTLTFSFRTIFDANQCCETQILEARPAWDQTLPDWPVMIHNLCFCCKRGTATMTLEKLLWLLTQKCTWTSVVSLNCCSVLRFLCCRCRCCRCFTCATLDAECRNLLNNALFHL